jgi:hypothetical protein
MQASPRFSESFTEGTKGRYFAPEVLIANRCEKSFLVCRNATQSAEILDVSEKLFASIFEVQEEAKQETTVIQLAMKL